MGTAPRSTSNDNWIQSQRTCKRVPFLGGIPIPNLTRSAAPYAVIENVVVDKALRDTGRGKQLMAATLQIAWNAGCYKAMLMTGSRNPATHTFYRACGFSADAKTGYVARPSRLTTGVLERRFIAG